MFSMLLRLCFTFLVACSVLAMPNEQAQKSKLPTSNTATDKMVLVKLRYACHLSVLNPVCTQDVNINNGKDSWLRLVYGEEDVLLKEPQRCSHDGVICLKAKRLFPPVIPSSVRLLTVRYKNNVASCPCVYMYDASGSKSRKSCKCELMMKIN
jgi:hypothetical protein